MLKQNARRLRKQMTDAERALWHLLRRKQIEGHRFRKQVPIVKYIVDFACLDARLVIEVDGGQHTDAADADRERGAKLGSESTYSRGYAALTCYAARRDRRALAFGNLSSMGAAVILMPSAASTLTTVENSGLPLSLRAL
jgi:very-short-patch-repair endonuclease